DAATLAAALRETSVAELKPGAPDGIVDLLVASGLSESRKAARRTLGEGGVSVNNVRIDREDWAPQPSDFLHGKWLVLRRGKRTIAGVEKL
ncbi:S4 domain-containing protein, partial [Mycobacterium avium]